MSTLSLSEAVGFLKAAEESKGVSPVLGAALGAAGGYTAALVSPRFRSTLQRYGMRMARRGSKIYRGMHARPEVLDRMVGRQLVRRGRSIQSNPGAYAAGLGALTGFGVAHGVNQIRG